MNSFPRNSLWKFRTKRPCPHYTGEILKQLFLTPKTHQIKCLSVHTTTPKKFENATITGHLGFVFKEISVSETTGLSWRYCLRKARFSKCFPSTLKRKAGVFKFLRFEERFPKAPFSWQISVDGRRNRRSNLAFSYFTGVAWTEPQSENCGDGGVISHKSYCTLHSILLYVDQSDASR